MSFGTPQGGNLSPMLSNIFLHYVLDLWFEKRIKRQVRGACFLVRYADDFLCMVQFQDDAQYIMQALRERFTRFSLALSSAETADRSQTKHALAWCVSFAEEPDVGNLQVRFRKGR